MSSLFFQCLLHQFSSLVSFPSSREAAQRWGLRGRCAAAHCFHIGQYLREEKAQRDAHIIYSHPTTSLRQKVLLEFHVSLKIRFSFLFLSWFKWH
jgi:hypothetical protein